jgi:hypothetical protein
MTADEPGRMRLVSPSNNEMKLARSALFTDGAALAAYLGVSPSTGPWLKGEESEHAALALSLRTSHLVRGQAEPGPAESSPTRPVRSCNPGSASRRAAQAGVCSKRVRSFHS